MLTKIEVEGVGIMRHLSDWQYHRTRRIANKRNQSIAFIAFGLGMTVNQFNKLEPELQKASWDAHNRLTAPDAIAPRRQPQVPCMPRPGEHVDIETQIEISRRLIEMKAQLPRGHFRVEDKSGVTYSQAQRWMKAAKDDRAASLRREAA